MKAKEFQEMTTPELNQKLGDLKTELFNLRFQLATGQLNNPMLIRQCKKNIARVNTILRLRQLENKAAQA
ncbi:MAG: 50S ribosomal protein L29 [Christensenellales bacterium]|jgi:large subunit ribosomal protein L29